MRDHRGGMSSRDLNSLLYTPAELPPKMLSLLDVETTCRLCLSSGGTEFASIQPYVGTLCNLTLFSLDNKLPQKMCRDCVQQVENAEALRRRVTHVESLWSRCTSTGKEVMVYCHVCSFQCPLQSLRGHVATQHGLDHLEKCLLCQRAPDATVSDSPGDPEQQGIQIVEVRGGIDDDQEQLTVLSIDLDPQGNVESLEMDDQIECEEEDSDYLPSVQVSGAEADSGSEAGGRDQLDKENSSNNLPTDRKEFQCPLCSFVTRTGFALRPHIKTKHPEQSVCMKCFRGCDSPAELSSHQIVCRQIVKCAVCKVQCANSQEYQNHLTTVHNKTTFVCDYAECGHVSLSKPNYINHRLTHSAVKKHRCNYEGCEAAFHSKCDLVKHERYIHTKVKPYSCLYCKRGFCSPSARLSHQRICKRKSNK